jgi:hypothetical protein
MSDIRKVAESYHKDNGDWDEWPYPTLTIESIITGKLRTHILNIYSLEDTAEVYLIETQVSGGYSEFTKEDECSIQVQVDGIIVWDSIYHMNKESAMAKFLTTFGGDVKK